MSDYGKDCDALGNRKIYSMKDCENAASYFKLRFNGSDLWTGYQKGCLEFRNAPGVANWNRITVGKRNANARTLCLGGKRLFGSKGI